MQSSRTFLFQMCLSLVVSTGSCSCKPLSNDIQKEDLEGYYSRLSERDLLEEEDTDSRLESLLGTMKEGFLRQLNLSDVPQEHNKIYPPQFMIELYNKYASNSTASPQSDVIRSFTVQDITHSVTNATTSWHRLQFNISVPTHERITAAELRLFLLPDAGSGAMSHKTTVKVYKVDYNEPEPTTHLLVEREVFGSHGFWETFDVTRAVQSWIKSGCGESGFDVEVDRKDCGSFEGDTGCLHLSVSVGDNTSAALIVFSDDLGSRKRETKKELREMILHEEETIFSSGANWNGEDHLPNEIPEALHPRRKKRKAEREYCRRTSLKVNFRDIGWDSWIVAPPEYDAFECRGMCYHPLTDESTPSKHALIQTLMNIRNPKKANMACCVPIKLDPITVMYQENGRLTIRYLYEEMKVAECGCR
ncbi:growth/differentiation factor 2 [Myripristis murdjan]|uniref:growth/differentiation factor 2 n=1 Tax=Myripristis murdjan TaxID=586833 RepID=UPI001175D8AB|nr:growth/differentiation factor 2-like [Myripristis murdjan]